jgi:hypothetical protein
MFYWATAVAEIKKADASNSFGENGKKQRTNTYC